MYFSAGLSIIYLYYLHIILRVDFVGIALKIVKFLHKVLPFEK